MPGSQELCWLPIAELAPMIHRRELSPVELAEALLAARKA